MECLSMHPFLYEKQHRLGVYVDLPLGKCEIEDDVWVAHNAIILPSVNYIGRGSVIGAGSVVTKDVPRYAIIAGNPARVIRYRFNQDIINLIEETRWWEMSLEELRDYARVHSSMITNPSSAFVYSGK